MMFRSSPTNPHALPLGYGDSRHPTRRAAGALFPTASTILVAYPAGPQGKTTFCLRILADRVKTAPD